MQWFYSSRPIVPRSFGPDLSTKGNNMGSELKDNQTTRVVKKKKEKRDLGEKIKNPQRS